MGGGMATGRMHYYACLDGCCEASTLFLGFLQMSKIKGGTFAARFRARFPKFLVANSFLLWLTFLMFRVMLFPYWLVQFGLDLRQMPTEIWNQLTMLELTFYPAVTLFLLILSSMWFLRLTKGAIKVFKAGGDFTKSGDSGRQHNDET